MDERTKSMSIFVAIVAIAVIATATIPIVMDQFARIGEQTLESFIWFLLFAGIGIGFASRLR